MKKFKSILALTASVLALSAFAAPVSAFADNGIQGGNTETVSETISASYFVTIPTAVTFANGEADSTKTLKVSGSANGDTPIVLQGTDTLVIQVASAHGYNMQHSTVETALMPYTFTTSANNTQAGSTILAQLGEGDYTTTAKTIATFTNGSFDTVTFTFAKRPALEGVFLPAGNYQDTLTFTISSPTGY